MKKLISIFLFTLLLFSCKSKKVVTELPVDTNLPATDPTFFEKITNPLQFDQIKISSKINIENGSFVPTLDATTYIENGEKIWMNIIAVILNVGRGIATKEGIKGYEKWNKTYIDSDFSYLNKLLNVNFIDYQSLQNLFTGKTFIPVNSTDFVLTKNAQGFALNSLKPQKFVTNGKTSLYSINLRYSENTDLVEVNLMETQTQESLKISYDNWVTENNLRLPKNVKIIIKNSKTSQILIENTTFAFDKMETPYTVPANYKKTEIR